jgi:hypothetical protein
MEEWSAHILRAAADAVVDGWGPEGAVVPVASIDWERVETYLIDAPASRSPGR